MKKYIKFILFISIYNSILFYGKKFGISVLLFNIPLLISLYFVYKENNLIKNKKGLLFSIPILILSLNYLVYDNEIFKVLNFVVISCLFILLHLYTINPAFNLGDLFNKFFTLIFEPFSCLPNVITLIKPNKNKNKQSNKKIKKIITSVFIIIPIVFIVLLLLASSDLIFGNIFLKFFKVLDNIEISESVFDIIGRITVLLILFFYCSSVLNYILFRYKKIKETKSTNNVDNYTIKLLLIVLDIIYIVFDIIQVRSLMLHKVSMDITYANYARSGFFQLMLVSIINLIIILFSKKVKSNEDEKFINILSICMVFLTLIIIISSFMRMCMYENAYGYTFLRLMIFITLITEVILLVPTIMYILNKKHKIVISYIIILISVYSLINIINVDYIIAKRNIDRFNKTNKIDIYYLMNGSPDNYKLLNDLKENTNNKSIKKVLSGYLNNVSFKMNGFQEFNISKYKANIIKKNDQ